MKDRMDILLEKALQPEFEPETELNNKIFEAMKTRKANKAARYTKVAVMILGGVLLSSTAVYAANLIIEKVFVTEHTISVGNPEYVDDAAIAADDGSNAQVDTLSEEKGNENVNWESKKVEKVNNFATNTYYEYSDFQKALTDSKLPNWFNKTYETVNNATYVVSEFDGAKSEELAAEFSHGNGTFFMSVSIMTGNVAEDVAHSLQLKNTGNERTYASAMGQEFTLVDEKREDGTVVTYVFIVYDSYFGYISFSEMTEEEIHQILDTVTAGKEK